MCGWWECIEIQPLWKIVWQCVTSWNIHLPSSCSAPRLTYGHYREFYVAIHSSVIQMTWYNRWTDKYSIFILWNTSQPQNTSHSFFKGMNYWYSKHEWLSKHYIKWKKPDTRLRVIAFIWRAEKVKGRLIGWSLWKGNGLQRIKLTRVWGNWNICTLNKVVLVVK